MIISNKTKRYALLVLAILSIVAIIDRAIRISKGELEWWQLVSVVIITGFLIKFYICCLKQK